MTELAEAIIAEAADGAAAEIRDAYPSTGTRHNAQLRKGVRTVASAGDPFRAPGRPGLEAPMPAKWGRRPL
jgi:hypothetical protein